jgi:hypothetical protein
MAERKIMRDYILFGDQGKTLPKGKTLRGYIMRNYEITAPKRKTMREYILKVKLKTLKRQLEIYTYPPCQHCSLVGHESQECPKRSLRDCEIIHSVEQNEPHPSKWDIKIDGGVKCQ